MELEFRGNTIVFNRQLTELDELVLKFVGVLEAQKVEYVIISGYVAILFGRSRNTEDIDLFVEKMALEKFELLWKALVDAGFECINASTAMEAFELYLQDGLALRFAANGEPVPNFEVKFPKNVYNRYSLENKLEVVLNGRHLIISELELQIAYKLYLGSEKDFEDARHLYRIFKENLNHEKLKNHVKELRMEKEAGEVLWPQKFQN